MRLPEQNLIEAELVMIDEVDELQNSTMSLPHTAIIAAPVPPEDDWLGLCDWDLAFSNSVPMLFLEIPEPLRDLPPPAGEDAELPNPAYDAPFLPGTEWLKITDLGISRSSKDGGNHYCYVTDEGLWGRTPLGKKLEADLAAKAEAGHFRRFTMISSDEPEQMEWDDHEDFASSGTESSIHPLQSELVQTEWSEYDDDASSGTESSCICDVWEM